MFKRILLTVAILAALMIISSAQCVPTTHAQGCGASDDCHPTPTPIIPTDTPVVPTDTPVPTNTPIIPTNTPVPTDTPVVPTETPFIPTNTPPPTPVTNETPTPTKKIVITAEPTPTMTPFTTSPPKPSNTPPPPTKPPKRNPPTPTPVDSTTWFALPDTGGDEYLQMFYDIIWWLSVALVVVTVSLTTAMVVVVRITKR